jgi:PIN domain nuclease of toxin-antitoxin system
LPIVHKDPFDRMLLAQVPSRTVLKLVDASSGMMMLSDQAARSMV